MPNEIPFSACVIQNVTVRSAALERRQDLLAEEPDVLHGQRVRQRAELKEPDQDANTELAGLGADLTDDVVRIAHDRQAFLLAQVEVELVEREILGLLDPGWSRRRRLP